MKVSDGGGRGRGGGQDVYGRCVPRWPVSGRAWLSPGGHRTTVGGFERWHKRTAEASLPQTDYRE